MPQETKLASKELGIDEAKARADVVLGADDIAEHGKINSAGGTRADFLSTRGAAISSRGEVQGSKKWKISYDLRTDAGKRGFREACEIMQPSQRLAGERAQKFQSKLNTVTLVDRQNGSTVSVPWQQAAFVAKKRNMVEQRKRLKVVDITRAGSEHIVTLNCGHRKWINVNVLDLTCPYRCDV